jgi:hypothetical protein
MASFIFSSMKNPLLVLAASVALLGQAAPAQASRRPSAPADTLLGHNRMVHRMSQQMCTALSADHATNFQTMTQAQAMDYTQKLLMPALMSDSTSLMQMAQLAAQQNMTPQDMGRLLGQDAFMLLRRDCPAALPLATRLAQQPATAPAPATAPKRTPAARPAGKKK